MTTPARPGYGVLASATSAISVSQSQDSISFEHLLRVLRRRWWLVAQLVIAGGAAGALLALSAPERYESTVTVLLTGALEGAERDGSRGSLTADAAARLIRTRGVAERVADEVPGDEPAGELLGNVSTSVEQSGAFVDVTARADAAPKATALANSFARQFIAARSEDLVARARRGIAQAERQLQLLPRGSDQRARLSSEIAELRATAALRGIEAEIVDPAVGAAELDEERLPLWTALGAGLGLLLGVIGAFSLAALDPRVRALQELRELTAAPQLAAIPPLRRRRRGQPPVLRSKREPFEHLRGTLLLLDGEGSLRRIVVTSATDRNEGKTPVAANLAVSLARLGLRTCAVDADLRSPSLAGCFGLDDAATGLADAIRGDSPARAIQRFSVPAGSQGNGRVPEIAAEVSVVSAGAADGDAAELLAGRRVQEVLDELERDHDVLVLDCAPVLALGDALPLLERTSGTVLVVRHSYTQRRSVTRAAKVVEARGALLGIVATSVPKHELAIEGYGPWLEPALPANDA